MGTQSSLRLYNKQPVKQETQEFIISYLAVCQNLVPLVNIKIDGKWMFIPLKMVLIGIDPFPFVFFLQRTGANLWQKIHASQTF
jgi:hypothetical protein